jgi:GrpB-like predicted nucleotidyltransferase (UPF0157 family)
MTTPIIIEEYDALWPVQFDTIRSRIASALGTFAAAIEHIGSTAVPGLPAKPIIDLDILLHSTADLPAVISKLKALGYEHQGTLGIPGREAFRAPAHDVPHHLYVCLPGCQEYLRHIAFRDYLRTHPKDADAYASLKHNLSGRFSIDRDAYTQAKTEFIEKILRRANATNAEHSSFPKRTIN